MEDLGPSDMTRKNRYKCVCGEEFIAYRYNVISGNTASCGCLRKKNPGRACSTTWQQILDAVARLPSVQLLSSPLENIVAKKTPIQIQCLRCGKVGATTFAKLKKAKRGTCSCQHSAVTAITWNQILETSASAQAVVLERPQFWNTRTKLRIRCRCGEDFSPTVDAFVRGDHIRCGCGNKGRQSKYTPESLIAAVQSMEATWRQPPPLKIEDVHSKISLTCRCGAPFSPKINAVLSGIWKSCGCIRSQPQADIAKYLESLGETVEVNNRRLLDGLEIDIWLPNRRIGIEYDGLHWHGQKLLGPEARASRLRKAKATATSGIQLIIIFEDEWLSRPEAVRARLAAILGRHNERLHARKCEIRKDASTPEMRNFVEQHHLQGDAAGKHYGLYDGDRLVAVAVFARCNASRARRGGWELMRYCGLPGVQVRGGLSRLIAAFQKDHPEIDQLLSYSDNRWSQGAVYRACNFELEDVGSPGYWYFQEPNRRHHRYAFRKQVLLRKFGGDPSKTEWELAQDAGYDRIWDLGAARWALRLKD